MAAQGLGEFEVTSCCRIEAKEGLVALDDKRLHVRQGPRLCGLGVAQQCAGGSDGGLETIGAKPGEGGRTKMRAQLTSGGFEVKVPVRTAGERRFGAAGQLLSLAEDDFRRADAL